MVYDNALNTNSTSLISWSRKHRTLQRGERNRGIKQYEGISFSFPGDKADITYYFEISDANLYNYSVPGKHTGNSK